MITVSIEGTEQAIEEARKRAVQNVNQKVVSRGTRAVNAIRNAELEVMRGQRSGRIYKKPGGGTYQASAPGEAPAVRTGNLRLSWSAELEIEGSLQGDIKVGAQLISNTEYAQYLEFGKRSPRPFVEKIQEKAYPDVLKIYKEPY